jgi:hypothetical protein
MAILPAPLLQEVDGEALRVESEKREAREVARGFILVE